MDINWLNTPNNNAHYFFKDEPIIVKLTSDFYEDKLLPLLQTEMKQNDPP